MTERTIHPTRWIFSRSLMVLGFGLCLAFGASPAGAQNQPNSAPDPQNQAPPGEAPPGAQSDQQAQATQPAPPATLTIPAGAVLRIRIDDWISSDRNVVGDNFSGELDQPIVVDGWVVARRGQAQTGRVAQVKKGKAGGSSELGVDIPVVTLVDGQQVPIEAQLFQASAGADRGRQVATVGSTTAVGALIGAIAGHGTGAAIGAGIGATAGLAGVMYTKGNPTTIAPETVLSFRLEAPVTISTEKSQFAFQPVSQSDYNSNPRPSQPQHRQRMNRPFPPPIYPYPYAFGYPYPYAYPWYPGPFVGFGFGYYGGWRR